MNRDKYTALIFKKLKGRISLEEQSLLDVWISQSEANEQWYQELEADWQLTQQYESEVALEVDVAGDFQLLQNRIRMAENLVESPKDNLRVAHQPIGKVATMKTNKTNRTWIGWAAAAVVTLALGFWFLDGRQSSVANEMLVLETEYQEKKQVALADGTKVWLNGNSQLRYPAAFEGNNRSVQLIGEAFFDVTKNPNQPFIIQTDKAKVSVLGTSFNVRAKLAESNTEVVVKTGKVSLANTAGDKAVVLQPNEKGIFDAEQNQVTKVAEKDLNELAWYSNRILFRNTPVAEVVTTLEELYEVKIEMQNQALNTCPWDGLYKMEDGVATILQKLTEDLNMTLVTTGNTAYQLAGGTCQN